MRYRLKLTPDDNGTFLVTSPDFPEVKTFGHTKAEAQRQGRAAIGEAIAARKAERTKKKPSKA
jgi:antitoxin HicB